MSRRDIYYWKCDRPAAFHGTQEQRPLDPQLEPQLLAVLQERLRTPHIKLSPAATQGNHLTWNADVAGDLYRDLVIAAKWDDAETNPESAPFQLADGFTEFLRLAELPVSVSQAIDAEADEAVLDRLAAEAAQQWTGAFNPRTTDVASFVELYRNAL